MLKHRLQAESDIRLVIGPGAGDYDYVRRLPFRRNGWAILIVAALDAAFLLPSIGVFRQAAAGWAGADQLFDLVIAIFLSAWLLAWVLAPLVLTIVLLALLSGRELLLAKAGEVAVLIGIPGLGARVSYQASRMRNLRAEQPAEKSGLSWRGAHLAFDYGSEKVSLGSALDAGHVTQITGELEAATGTRFRRGPASASELAEERAADQHAAFRPLLAPAGPAQEAVADGERPPLTLSSPSTLALIAANLVPLLGAALWGWNLGDVMVLYWAETAIVGFYNVLKIIVIGRWFALLAVPFFVGHFSAFMAIHFLFIDLFFLGGLQSGMNSAVSAVAAVFAGLSGALLALIISHGFSFLHNFIGQQEYRTRSVANQMHEPYSRVIFMHLVIIFGGGLALVLGEPTLVILLTILAKILVDVRAHLKQHAADSNRVAVAS
jgi:hypothetical protein